MSKLCKPRRLWRPAVATHPRTENTKKLIGRNLLIHNSKFKIPNSSAVPPKTIFAFLTLNTMS